MTTIPFTVRNRTEFEDQNKFDSSQIIFSRDFTRLIHCPNSIKGSYEIPVTIIRIGIEAFAECKSLNSIIIPASVKAIDIFAFRNCTGLKSIILQAKNPIRLAPDSDVFLNIDKANCELYVPIGSMQAYQEAKQWGEFKKIVGLSERTVDQLNRLNFKDVKQAI